MDIPYILIYNIDYSRIRGPYYDHSCLWDLQIGLLQCVLHRTLLEDHSETSASAECGGILMWHYCTKSCIVFWYASRCNSRHNLRQTQSQELPLKSFMAWDQFTYASVQLFLSVQQDGVCWRRVDWQAPGVDPYN